MTTNYKGYEIKALQYPTGEWRASAKRLDGSIVASTEDYDCETAEEAIDVCKELVDEFLYS